MSSSSEDQESGKDEGKIRSRHSRHQDFEAADIHCAHGIKDLITQSTKGSLKLKKPHRCFVYIWSYHPKKIKRHFRIS